MLGLSEVLVMSVPTESLSVLPSSAAAVAATAMDSSFNGRG